MTPMRIGTACLSAFRRAIVPAMVLVSVPAGAVVNDVVVHPANPTPCDTILFTVRGTLPDDCHEIVGATVRGPEPIPCMRPGPCPSQIHVDIVVREPNPEILRPCLLNAPYTRSFDLHLNPGGYTVIAHERVIPFSGSDSTVSESFASTTFSVAPDSVCPAPGPGCYLLGFHDPTLDPLPHSPVCDATAPPGGNAYLPVTLTNTTEMGGLQTKLVATRRDGSTAAPDLRVVSVNAVRRAAGFQVSWSADGANARILLYSTTGAVIAPGDAPLLSIGYSVAPGTSPQTFLVADSATIVANAAGNALPVCPTLVPVAPGTICVSSLGCDVNGDGVSDVLDVIRIVQCALRSQSDSGAGCPDSIAARADCNGNRSIDIRDVICCVRKILGSRGGTSTLGIGPSREGENAIGFEGPVLWRNEVDGTAVLRIETAHDWGGTEFAIDLTGARVRGLRILNPQAADQLEWGADGPGARAMLFTTGQGAGRSYRVEVALERSSSIEGGIGTLARVRAGTSLGDPAQITSFNPTLQISAAPVKAPVLLAARPNPSAGGTEIGFVLPSEARVSLRIFDVSGRLVRTLADGPRSPGVHRLQWDGTDARGRTARSGLYFAKFEAGMVRRSERILLMR